MKRTHYSVGTKRAFSAHRLGRLKHETLCGVTCDRTKGTTNQDLVTCRDCFAKLATRPIGVNPGQK